MIRRESCQTREPDLDRYEKLGRRYWGRHLWSRGYCVSTIGSDEDKIRKYVKWQENKACFGWGGLARKIRRNRMSNKILVTFASRTGSTAGIAKAIGQTLIESGAEVDVRPMQNVEDIAPYRAVVAGSAIQGKQWLPEAMQFMRTFQTQLARKPVAAFSVCMTLAMRDGEKYRPHVADWLMSVRTLVRPVSEGLFAGVLDISKIPSFGDRLKFRLSVVFGAWSEGDHRDWDAIREWASDLYSLLLS